MDGSDGKDTLTGTLNNDTINGLKGDDMLSGSEGNDVINGGEGIDTLNGNEGNDLLYGDAGDDKLSDNLGSNQFYGGDGKDTITINNAVTASQFADGGADNDTFDISYRAGDHIITTGTGSDTIKLNSPQVGTGIITVTDFTTGASGDVFDIAGLVSSSGANGKDPFATGYLRLLQRGDNVELQWDKDGAANGAVWTTVVVFEDTVASAYTKANLATVYNPVVAQDAGLVGLADPLHDGYI
jgi:Ca2+-binding RTX toxin-like protein